jgi:hypothetical protein
MALDASYTLKMCCRMPFGSEKCDLWIDRACGPETSSALQGWPSSMQVSQISVYLSGSVTHRKLIVKCSPVSG